MKTTTPVLDNFKSQAQLGKKRPADLPLADPDPWDGYSVFETWDQVLQWQKTVPRLGSYIAEFWVRDGAALQREPADVRGHFNIWGDPAVVRSCLKAILDLNRNVLVVY
jgi:hypothetical protein